MAFNNQQRVPNVSRYLANLNQISPVADMSGLDDFSTDPSLDNLANLDFFDFESFNPDVNLDQIGQMPHKGRKQSANAGVNSPTNFSQFPEFQSFTQPSQAANPVNAAAFPARAQQYTATQQQQPVQQAQPATGEKRKVAAAAEQLSSPYEFEEGGRVAAEEDKRRRNTAASARFRVKKKQREAALEKQAKEMTDRVQELEDRVKGLTMENKWLRELITDKKDLKTFEAFKLAHTEERETEKAAAAQGSKLERDDGVGTVDADEEIDEDDA